MRKAKGRVPDGRVFEIRDINAITRYLHPDYEYVQCDGTLRDNDWLLIFEVRPKTAGPPSFKARWDGGNRAAPQTIRYDLDIDIHGVSNAEVERFKKSKDGYSGHHTKKTSADENRYDIYLTTPAGLIFDAAISFSKHHALSLGNPIDNVATVSTTRVPAGTLTKLKSFAMSLYQVMRSILRFWG